MRFQDVPETNQTLPSIFGAVRIQVVIDKLAEKLEQLDTSTARRSEVPECREAFDNGRRAKLENGRSDREAQRGKEKHLP
jgi:hypothetical protein